MRRIKFLAIIAFSVLLGLLSQTLLAAKLEVACTVTAGISDGPNPNPACVGEKVTVELTADVPPLYREECDNFTEMWSWSILSVTFNGAPRPTSKFQLSNSNSRTPTLTAPEGSLDEEGTWVVTVKVTGTFTSEACEDCTSSDELPITVEVGCGRIQEVSFSGDTFTVVLEDRSNNRRYEAPHWLDKDDDGNAADVGKGERRYPVSYRRDSFVTIQKAVLKTCEAPEKAMVRATGPDGMNLPATEAAVNGNTVTISNVQLEKKFPNTIKFYNTFNLNWELSFDDGTTWCKAGTSDNRVYVRLEAPLTSLHETYLDIGCRSADGKDSPSTAFAAFWAEFATMSVERKDIDGHNQKDGIVMQFWTERNSPLLASIGQLCQTASAMIDPMPARPALNGIGTCDAWADLLREVAQVQGIMGVKRIGVLPDRQKVQRALGLMINKWSFGDIILAGANGVADTDGKATDLVLAAKGTVTGKNIPYIFPGTDGKLDTNPTPDDIKFSGLLVLAKRPPYTHAISLDAIDVPGVKSQGSVQDPPSLFQNHFIVLFGNQFYDPSYGTGPFPSTKAWEDASLAGIAGTQFNIEKIGNIKLPGGPFTEAKADTKGVEELEYAVKPTDNKD